MENKEYIESGILELYVYGLLSETENEEVTTMAKNNPDINAEIIAIEKAIVSLSSSFSPFHSVEIYEKIKAKLELNPTTKVIEMEPTRNWAQYVGWAAAILLLVGIGFQYNKLEQTSNQVVNATTEKIKIEQELNQLELKNKASETSLAIVRDIKNTVVPLGGQDAAPESSAKVYWNKETQVVYIDAAGLPEPPKGMVYQIWSLKLQPQLTPTSIGLLSDFTANEAKIFAVDKTADAEAFAITLEPAGGSLSPTMEQLYTLGKV
ncbi:anti-sigma factor [Flavobacterium sp. W22_SRS_FP1]|uniref:anti-sigma factor n=1 Tax=Flavobacterium sp. W22_SRS_FP1 TaxID=3240276 RepID=UPI003F9255DB